MKKSQKRRGSINISSQKNLKRINYSEQVMKNFEKKYKESRKFDQYCWDQSSKFMAGITDEEYEKRIEELCAHDALIKHLFE